jgi:hypothetical protein
MARVASALLLGLGACSYATVEAVTGHACTETLCAPALDASWSSLDASASLDATRTAEASAARDARTTRDAAEGNEICDGTDNDGDGVIDDVDLGGDGICDCLTLATMGVQGRWGAGDVLADWLRARSDNGAVSLDGQLLTAQLLSRYRVIVVRDLRSFSFAPEEFTALQEWIRGGGGLITTSGYAQPAERANANAILAATGVQYDDTQVLSAGPGTIAVTTWYPHPVSAGVRALGVDTGYAVVGAGEVVAELSGVVVLRAVTYGEGRVLVWADDWITYDSEWEDNPQYQVERFWLNAIKWLSPPRDCQVAIPTYL